MINATKTTMANGRILSSSFATVKRGGASRPNSSRFASSQKAQSSKKPFYGVPREERNYAEPRSIPQRISLAIHHATAAFSDPTRADAVAALGEITGTVSLERIRQEMLDDETGRWILEERPIISKATIPYERLIAEAPENPSQPGITFGQAYGYFLKSHKFDPDERDAIKYIEDPTLAYIMLRYRQVCNR
jgi:ubiquinone biosynthesis protein Coq4